MGVDAAVHQISHHQVVLHSHESFGVDGQVPIRGQGEGRDDALQIQLAIAGAGAVAVAHQIVQPIAVQLAADQGLDHRALSAPTLQQGCDPLGRAWSQLLKQRVNLWVFANETG